jgi:hypothetical protein
VIVAFATGVTFALGIILLEGGGSLTKGWNPGLGYLSFYGVFMLPILAIVGLIAIGLSRLLGGGIVILLATIGLGALLIHSTVTSTPGAQLTRVTGRPGIPKLRYERFEIRHTFSDGTAYLWVAQCSPKQATELINALGMGRIPTMTKFEHHDTIMVEHQAVGDYRGMFGNEIEGVEFYMDRQGMIGGYSAGECRFRLYWWPAALRELY